MPASKPVGFPDDVADGSVAGENADPPGMPWARKADAAPCDTGFAPEGDADFADGEFDEDDELDEPPVSAHATADWPPAITAAPTPAVIATPPTTQDATPMSFTPCNAASSREADPSA